MPTLVSFVIVSAALLGIGIYGLSVKRNAIRILFSVELIVNAANLNFVAFTRYMNPPQVSGQVIVFYSIAAAAMEAAVGLALILVAFRLNSSIDVRKLNKLKGYAPLLMQLLQILLVPLIFVFITYFAGFVGGLRLVGLLSSLWVTLLS